jgi:hypothetical protein
MGPSKYFGIKYLFSFLHPYSEGDLGGGLASLACVHTYTWNATDTCVEAGRLLVADLYDLKGSAKSVHRDLNKLRVKLALSKDSSLVKFPLSEAAFRQYILRVAFLVSKNCCFKVKFVPF